MVCDIGLGTVQILVIIEIILHKSVLQFLGQIRKLFSTNIKFPIFRHRKTIFIQYLTTVFIFEHCLVLYTPPPDIFSKLISILGKGISVCAALLTV